MTEGDVDEERGMSDLVSNISSVKFIMRIRNRGAQILFQDTGLDTGLILQIVRKRNVKFEVKFVK